MGKIFECERVVKMYGAFPALQNVSLSLESGRIVGLLGPNGSGKTTLIKLANGLLTPTAGVIRIDGKPVGEGTKAVVSYLPERTYLNDWMKVKDILKFFEDFYGDFNLKKAEDMLSRLSISANMRLKTMSKGTKEKVQLVLVMSRDAKMYFLDEPIGGVDPATRDYILDTIIGEYNPEACVVISTHLITDIERILDDIVFINQGQIVLQGEADVIRESNGKSIDQLFREVFRC